MALIDTLQLDAWLAPWVPVTLVGAYLVVSKPVVAVLRDALGVTPKGSVFRAFMVAHNLALFVFSAWVFANCAPILYNYTATKGFRAVHEDEEFWRLYGKWAVVFYVSKFYEFMDSWVLVLKGVKPSFLQVYHHSGVVFAMYFAVLSRSNWLVYMVVLNSFIHTLMYFYYTFSCLGYKSPLAKVLTSMQLTQFVVGIFLSAPSYWMAVDMQRENNAALLFMHVYAIGLIYLFKQMFDQKYEKKPKEGDEKKL